MARRFPMMMFRAALSMVWNSAIVLTGGISMHASTYGVISTADDGSPGTLRWAIEQANANAGSTINFADNLGTIGITSQMPLITATVTINGNNSERIFFIDTPNATDAVVINNLALVNGFAKGGDGGLSGGLSGGGGLGAGGAILSIKEPCRWRISRFPEMAPRAETAATVCPIRIRVHRCMRPVEAAAGDMAGMGETPRVLREVAEEELLAMVAIRRSAREAAGAGPRMPAVLPRERVGRLIPQSAIIGRRRHPTVSLR